MRAWSVQLKSPHFKSNGYRDLQTIDVFLSAVFPFDYDLFSPWEGFSGVLPRWNVKRSSSLHLVCYAAFPVPSSSLPPETLSVIRGRMVSQAPRGRWEEREILETTGLQESVEKMDLRVSKARWVLKENLAHLVLLGRRFVAAVMQALQNNKNLTTYNSNILHILPRIKD